MDFKVTLSEGEWATIRAALLVAQDTHFEAARTLRKLPIAYPVYYDEIVASHHKAAEAAGNVYTKLSNNLEQA